MDFQNLAVQTGVKILVVDNDPVIRKHLPVLLKNSGHIVSDAGSGEEALDVLGKEEHHLALVDYYLGEGRLDGLQTIMRARDMACARNTWLYLYSSREFDKSRWMAARADGHILKGNPDLILAIAEARMNALHGPRTAEVIAAFERRY